jgi:uncharacterized membrane protein YeaQ/YmgE (transglycosylase-associated protein family)
VLNFLLWVIVGSSAGWLANRLLRSTAYRKTGLNILAGIEGAALGGLGFSPLFGVNPISRTFSVPALLLALGGALLLLGGVNWFRRHRMGSCTTDVSKLWPIRASFRGICQANHRTVGTEHGNHRTEAARRQVESATRSPDGESSLIQWRSAPKLSSRLTRSSSLNQLSS